MIIGPGPVTHSSHAQVFGQALQAIVQSLRFLTVKYNIGSVSASQTPLSELQTLSPCSSSNLEVLRIYATVLASYGGVSAPSDEWAKLAEFLAPQGPSKGQRRCLWPTLKAVEIYVECHVNDNDEEFKKWRELPTTSLCPLQSLGVLKYQVQSNSYNSSTRRA